MKKFFAILAILSVMMIPCAAMAMDQASDADLAAITGQSGVSITVSDLGLRLKLGTITYGDMDGIAGDAAYTSAGYVNMAFPNVAFTMAVQGLNLDIDIGTAAITPATGDNPFTVATVETDAVVAAGTRTVVQIKTTLNHIQVNAIELGVYLDGNNGVGIDYAAAATSAAITYAYSAGNMGFASLDTRKCIGLVGITGIDLTITTPLTLQISAH